MLKIQFGCPCNSYDRKFPEMSKNCDESRNGEIHGALGGCCVGESDGYRVTSDGSDEVTKFCVDFYRVTRDRRYE